MRFISGSVLTCLLLSSVAPVWAQQSPAGPIIDKQAAVASRPWLDNRDAQRYRASIPFIGTPDKVIDDTFCCRHDGMETSINSRLTDTGFAGAPGVRPAFASYMSADAPAIATEFEAKAAPLGKGVQDIQTFMVHTVATSQIRLVIDQDGDGRTGITELMAWEH